MTARRVLMEHSTGWHDGTVHYYRHITEWAYGQGPELDRCVFYQMNLFEAKTYYTYREEWWRTKQPNTAGP